MAVLSEAGGCLASSDDDAEVPFVVDWAEGAMGIPGMGIPHGAMG